MSCKTPKPIHPSIYWTGLQNALPQKDGYTILLSWNYAIQSFPTNSIGYNIYYSTDIDTIFSEGPKLYTTQLSLYINGFSPGTITYFGLRSQESDPKILKYSQFPQSQNALGAYIYPTTFLSSDIDGYTTIIPLVDVSDFPSIGILEIGNELLYYKSIDYSNNIIFAKERGTYNTDVTIHQVDGYDGYEYQDPTVRYFSGFDDQNNIIIEVDPRFEPEEFAYTEADGYKQTAIDILNTNLSASDASNVDFPTYDYSGYHQTNILDYFSSHCIGSYAGGEYGCKDGYMMRGLNLQDINTQRLDMLLDVEGEPVVLLRRLWTGIRCNCYRANQENPEGRCPICFGTGYVGGYEQYYNPRRPDSRIMCRIDPVTDRLLAKPIGLQQELIPSSWTLVVPKLLDRDVLVRFNQDGTEEYRYEILGVTRNRLLFGLSGSQKFTSFRIDKSDIIYQWRAVRSTFIDPITYNTTIGILRSYGPHIHQVTIGNNIVNLAQINGTTSENAGHNHSIINGIISPVLSHQHTIIF